ncbi:MAG TPA: rhomboid family intramembrane serine protease [Chitinophagaceae bacterium]|jgi:membrane associated rhomboid family serine protease|nr:rhomboid family intramembrane serine protease [Chitinophagaceae bacterium]
MEVSITIIIIIATSIISFIAFSNRNLMEQFIFYPPAVRRGQIYRFFSCGLIHADWGHLIFNMISLYLFGEAVESKFMEAFGPIGKLVYLGMYVLALAASVIPTYINNKDNYHYRSLGASGAVSAVVFAGILFFPLAKLGLFFIPIYVAGFIFGLIYLLVSGWLDRRGGGNINHSAHIFGALFGVGFTIIACQGFSDYPVLTSFVDAIKNVELSQLIQFGP